MIPFILAAVAFALSVPGIVLAVRALPAVTRMVDAGIKPWACDICMGFWATGLLAAATSSAMHDLRFLLCCGPAYTVALLILGRLQAPPPLPAPPAFDPTASQVVGLAEHLEGP